MSPKTFVISVSLICSAAVFACWMFAGETADHNPNSELAKPSPGAAARTTAKASRIPNSVRADHAATVVPQPPVAQTRQRPVPTQPFTNEERTARAARVEQEANHDLRRLVELLDLDEEQQDKVFQTLAQHSTSWVPGMQFAPAPDKSAGTAGKPSEPRRSEALPAVPGLYLPPPGGGDITALVKTPGSAAEGSAADTDPTEEIMALLNPDQQDTFLQEEMDRTAWWAEVLEQITPPDNVPGITGTPPPAGGGETTTYEGADVLD